MKRLIYILFAFVIFSCETEIEIELSKQDDLLVINAIFASDTSTIVDVSKTINIIDATEIPSVVYAEVSIFQGEKLVSKLAHEENSLYLSDFKPQVNVDYTLKVNAKGLPEAKGNFKLPTPVQIKDAVIFKNKNNEATRFNLVLDDPANESNYYIVSVEYASNEVIGGVPHTEYREIHLTPKPPFEDEEWGFRVFGQNSAKLFASGIYDGKELKYAADVNFYFNSEIDVDYHIYCKLYSISKDYYLYLTSKEKQSYVDGDPFSQPITVKNNIEGGYGIVGAYSVATKEVRIETSN